GQTKPAERFATALVDDIVKLESDTRFEAILTTASGCGSTIRDYGFHLQGNAKAPDIAAPTPPLPHFPPNIELKTPHGPKTLCLPSRRHAEARRLRPPRARRRRLPAQYETKDQPRTQRRAHRLPPLVFAHARHEARRRPAAVASQAGLRRRRTARQSLLRLGR